MPCPGAAALSREPLEGNRCSMRGGEGQQLEAMGDLETARNVGASARSWPCDARSPI